MDKDYWPAPVPRDIGWSVPDAYFYRTMFWLKEFGVMPERGGLNDQDQAWVDDVERYWMALREKERDRDQLEKDLAEMKGQR